MKILKKDNRVDRLFSLKIALSTKSLIVNHIWFHLFGFRFLFKSKFWLSDNDSFQFWWITCSTQSQYKKDIHANVLYSQGQNRVNREVQFQKQCEASRHSLLRPEFLGTFLAFGNTSGSRIFKHTKLFSHLNVTTATLDIVHFERIA